MAPRPPARSRPAREVGIGGPRAWTDALLTAGAILGVLVLPGALLVLAALVALGPDAARGSLALVPAAAALAVGGTVAIRVDLGALGGLDTTLSATPLLVTGAAFATGAWLLLARTAPLRTLGGIVAQAARTVLVLLVGLAALAALVPADAVVSVAVLPTLLGAAVWAIGFLTTAVVWRRPDVLGPRAGRVRDLVAGPVAGLGAVVGTCWLVALAMVVAAVLTRTGSGIDDGSWMPGLPLPGVGEPGTGTTGTTGTTGATGAVGLAALLVVVLYAPSAVLAAFAVGLGVPAAGDPGGSALATAVEGSPAWWLVPLVGLVVCTLGGTVSALHARTVDAALRRSAAFGPALALLLVGIALATAVSADGTDVGADVGWAALLGLGWGLGGGLLGAAVAPGLPRDLRRERLEPTRWGRVVAVTAVLVVLAAALLVGLRVVP